MQVAPLPDNEEERLKKLYELGILDTLEEQDYDDLTSLAAQICNVPIALISLVDRDRQFFKSCHGIEINEAPRDIGFCPHAILNDGLMIIEDATKDERFHDNPAVADGPKIRFYAGAPLIFENNIRIGTICIVGKEPRTLKEEQKQAMRALARQVVKLLELRLAIKQQQLADQQRSEVIVRLVKSEQREHARSMVLEMLARDASLETVMETLARNVEEELVGAHCSILLLDSDGKRLFHCAAPTLPSFYNESIHGLEIGPEVGSCGAAAFTGKRVIVEDIHTHPNWANFTDLTNKANLSACWSEPVIDSSGNVLGTFAIYYPDTRTPSQEELAVIESSANLVGIAIQTKRKEELLIKTRKSAEAANRAKSDFLSTMSHELRTPVTSIQGSLGLIIGKATGELPKLTMDMIEIALKNSTRLIRLINDLLDISKIEAGKLEVNPQNLELGHLLSQSIETNRAYATQKGITLNFDMPDEPYHAMVDENHFEQIVSNLISNAVKFSDKSDLIDIKLIKHEDSARISVTDYGTGISQEFQSRIFQKFTQQDATDSRQRGGTGLGLAISKHLVKSMDGEIGLESEQGKGSQFYFDLPLVESLVES